MSNNTFWHYTMIMLFNMVFTALPILTKSIFDWDIYHIFIKVTYYEYKLMIFLNNYFLENKSIFICFLRLINKLRYDKAIWYWIKKIIFQLEKFIRRRLFFYDSWDIYLLFHLRNCLTWASYESRWISVEPMVNSTNCLYNNYICNYTFINLNFLLIIQVHINKNNIDDLSV